MIAMVINLYLITTSKLAVTAVFEELSLRFIKYMGAIINCWGVICKSNLVTFLYYSHELANEYYCHYIPAIAHSIMRLNPWGAIIDLLSLPIGGLDE